MSVNKLLTFINNNCERRKEDNSLLETSDKYTDVFQIYSTGGTFCTIEFRNRNSKLT